MYALIMTTIFMIFYLVCRINNKYRKLLIATSTLISLIYIVWRISVIPFNNGLNSLILGILLYAAELLGLIAFFNFLFLFNNKYKLELKTLNDFKGNQIPSVDVLICTYNEPLSLLEKTIAASTNLNYPKNKLKIYVCDDGKRDSLKDLCSMYKVNYLTRDDNEGAKAGNINNALKHIKGDLFAVLDADMIPKKEFLQKTVGYFSDENMSFVQTPQVYYNQDMYQYNLNINIPNEQDFFMRFIQEARASKNAVLHVGTNAIFKKKYVDEIGGYPTCSITEDMAVGMLLQANGYNSEFVNEELVLGLSATTFTELVKQRDRWCRGNLQVLKHFNPLFTKGLSLGQKIAYFDGAVYWFSNLQKFIYIICPLIYLLTSTLIIDSNLSTLLNYYIPFFISQYFIFKVLSPNVRTIKWAHYYDMAMAPHLSLSILKEIFCLDTKFNVTSKDITQDNSNFQFRIVLPHIILLIISIIAWIISTIFVLHNKIHFGAYLLNLSWSIFNFMGCIICIKVAYQKPIFRLSERITVKNKIYVELEYDNSLLEGYLLDLSIKGAGIKLSASSLFNINDIINIKIYDKYFKCKVSRNKNNILGLTFESLNTEQMKLLVNIFTENMQPHYTIDTLPNYVINQKDKPSQMSA